MSDEEIPLLGGRSTDGIVRVGDTVRRPPDPNAAFVHDLLAHLEAVGFTEAPKYLGVDEKGREVLTYIEGETSDGWFEDVLRDDQLAAIGAMLRRFHDATADSLLRVDAECVIHGDAGPFNMVWRDGLPIALIDFGRARPGRRLEEIAEAVWKGCLFEEWAIAERGHDPRAEGQRARALLEGYGSDHHAELVDAMVIQIEVAEAAGRATPDTDQWFFDDWAFVRTWLQVNRDAFEEGLG